MIDESLQFDLLRGILFFALAVAACSVPAILFVLLNKISKKLDQVLESLNK